MSEKNQERELVAMAVLARGAEEFRRRAAVSDSLGDAFASASNQVPAQRIADAWQLAVPETATTATGEPVELLEFVTERIAISKSDQTATRTATAPRHYPLRPLELSDAIFNAEATPESSVTDQLATLWRQFTQEQAHLGSAIRFDTLLALMEKYTWSIRSTTDATRAAVSLYDHTRTAAAIAVCLHAAEPEHPAAEFLLIEAGISGIQQFIYSPTFNGQELQDGMARRLRGRSFYLNLLVKTLADFLTTELQLTRANTLWATGGHLLILAPNTTATRQTLATVRKQIQQWLWREHRGALGVIISDLPASRAELDNFGELRGHLEQISARQKLQLAELPLSFGDQSPDEAWDSAWVLRMQEGICRDTGRDLSHEELEISDAGRFPEYEETPATRSRQSLLFDAIGRALLNAKTIQLRRESDWLPNADTARLPRDTDEAKRLTQSLDEIVIEFAGLGRTWLLTEQRSAATGAELCLRLGNHENPELQFLPDELTPGVAYGFELMATAVATEEVEGRKRIQPFEKLAEAADGAKYLGALRMDVDDLGYLFAHGLHASQRSIAKLANLSRMFDWFFAGYLNTLVADKPLYTTYAGGDDLFVVGAWDKTLWLADSLQRQFRNFCGSNPALHISAGIALCRGKYPLGRAAEDAGERLDQVAKSAKRSNRDTEKDALAFLERKIPWKHWAEVQRLGEKMIVAYDQGKLSRKFVHTLLALYQQHVDPQRKPGADDLAADLIWLPRFKYSLVRNVEDDFLRNELVNQIEKHEQYLSILAGYVLLKTRNRTSKPQSKAATAA